MSMVAKGHEAEDGRRSATPSGSARLEPPALRAQVEDRLRELIPSEEVPPQTLHKAIRYSVLAGGKRVRALLTIRVATDFGAPLQAALDPACAIEMIHAASLILDDLPCMDDATLRRGKQANHRVFGEDTAILAAMALLNQAFAVVADCAALDASTRLELTRLLSESVGSNGIIAGQFRDLRMQKGRQGHAELTAMYAQKTGALFVAALETGARVAGLDESRLHAVREYGANLGIAFQLLDDLLDAFGSAEGTGKDVGQDDDKANLAALLGANGTREEVTRYVESAASALEPLGDSGASLIEFARSYTESTLESVTLL